VNFWIEEKYGRKIYNTRGKQIYCGYKKQQATGFGV
jgi:hypothetical protein